MRIDELGLCELDYEVVEVNSTRWLDLSDLKNEIWRDVIGFEGLYEVSNYGRVKGLTRKIKSAIKNNNSITKHGCVLKQHKKHNRYWGVALCKNGKHYNKQVHVLVGQSFLQPDVLRPCIDHIQPVSSSVCNNCLYNLRYATHMENSNFAKEKGRLKQPIENYKKRVIKMYNGTIIKSYNSIRECSRLENISRQTLYKKFQSKITNNDYEYKLVNHNEKTKE